MLQSETLSLSAGVQHWFERISTKKKLKLEEITIVVMVIVAVVVVVVVVVVVIVVVVVVSKSGIAVQQIFIGKSKTRWAGHIARMGEAINAEFSED